MEIIENIRENPFKYIKTFAMDIVVVLVAVAYIFYQMVKLEPTDLNPLILLAQAVVGIVCGVVIKQALGENGFSKGYNSAIWNEEEEKYNEVCNTAVEYTDRVDNFYLYIEQEKRENYRRTHLQSVRLRYDDWFDKQGNYIGKEEHFNKLTFWQKRMVRKCVRVKIYVLSLFSEYANSSEQDTKREMTDKRQRGKNFTKNTFSAMLVAVLGAYFVPIISGWSWGNLIMSSFQVSLWVLFGVMQLYTNYNFVVQDKVSILRKKKELITRFVKNAEQDMYIKSPYDEE